jgi:hypothetical protein
MLNLLLHSVLMHRVFYSSNVEASCKGKFAYLINVLCAMKKYASTCFNNIFST